ncbi:hypothetical protein BDR03DRAFT_976520 [Suillus americanus]|nr:hypothetical protein BDR03DRAFT_976520 [Suillus americanus]
MRLSFILAVATAFRLTVSMPVVDEDQCSYSSCGPTGIGDAGECCSGYECRAMVIPVTVGMSSFHSTP